MTSAPWNTRCRGRPDADGDRERRGRHAGRRDETFFVTLSNPVNGVIGDGQGTGIIVDDDGAGVVISITTGLTTTEAGGADTFTVALQSQPTATVMVEVGSSDPSEGTVSPTELTFDATNWQTPQTVTVTGVDDDVDDGDVAYTVQFNVSSADPDYDGISVAAVSATNVDDEPTGYMLYIPQYIRRPYAPPQ